MKTRIVRKDLQILSLPSRGYNCEKSERERERRGVREWEDWEQRLQLPTCLLFHEAAGCRTIAVFDGPMWRFPVHFFEHRITDKQHSYCSAVLQYATIFFLKKAKYK